MTHKKKIGTVAYYVVGILICNTGDHSIPLDGQHVTQGARCAYEYSD